MTNIAVGGIYRDCNVRITEPHSTARLTVVRDEMRFLWRIKRRRKDLHPVSYAAWIHAEFVRIHPFVDGNGRTARMLLNFALLEERHKPIVIDSKDRASYYDALDAYGMSRDLAPFDRFVSELELATLADYRAEIQRALLSRSKRRARDKRVLRPTDVDLPFAVGFFLLLTRDSAAPWFCFVQFLTYILCKIEYVEVGTSHRGM